MGNEVVPFAEMALCHDSLVSIPGPFRQLVNYAYRQMAPQLWNK